LKVGAIGLNRLEVVYRSGGFGAPNKYPAVLGSECAGTVEAIGKGVTGFRVKRIAISRATSMSGRSWSVSSGPNDGLAD